MIRIIKYIVVIIPLILILVALAYDKGLGFRSLVAFAISAVLIGLFILYDTLKAVFLNGGAADEEQHLDVSSKASASRQALLTTKICVPILAFASGNYIFTQGFNIDSDFVARFQEAHKNSGMDSMYVHNVYAPLSLAALSIIIVAPFATKRHRAIRVFLSILLLIYIALQLRLFSFEYSVEPSLAYISKSMAINLLHIATCCWLIYLLKPLHSNFCRNRKDE